MGPTDIIMKMRPECRPPRIHATPSLMLVTQHTEPALKLP